MSTLLTAARNEAAKFIKTGGFGEVVTLQNPLGDVTVSVTSLATKHHINFDSDGLPINSKNVHVALVESELASVGYPVRNANEEVNLLNHKVSYPDSTGVVKTYVISEHFPDETLGLIVCILRDYHV